MPKIETKKITQDCIDFINKFTPQELENRFRKEDFLYLLGIAFSIVFYSGDEVTGGQSVEVIYWSEYYDMQINMNWRDNTVEVITPCIRNWTF
jgi:hypothetical protein